VKPPIFVDFETLPIDDRPNYPPEPIGAALRLPGEPPVYRSWGSTQRGSGAPYDATEHGEVAHLLWKIWESGNPLVFHNAKFDLEVAEQYFTLGLPDWRRVHDTQILAYLNDPHAPSLGLKPLAVALLGMPHDEQDALGDFVVANAKMLRQIDAITPVTRPKAGAWIWAMPPALVRPYAIGDVVRTEALFNYLLPIITELGMGPAYDRERELMPILLRNEQEGMRVDQEQLGRDCHAYFKVLFDVEAQLRDALHAPGLNFDADQQVAEALLARGLVLAQNMPRTKGTQAHPHGQWSLSKQELRRDMFEPGLGQQFASVLGYRNRLSTCLNTFMQPWFKQASQNGGRITTSWNQTRGEGGGARTGRPSTSNHNFLNIPKEFGKGRDQDFVFPDFVRPKLPPLPLCRMYVLADEGCAFLHRDFSGQELRVFAHFEQGLLWQAYQDDPKTDPHEFIGNALMEVAGREIHRDPVKIMNFQGLYGGGAPALQKALRCTMDEARELKAFHDRALPGRRILNEEIERVIKRGFPVVTLGGRLFFVERPGLDGRSKLYKLLNYLVQGSAADMTKQAIIDWHNDPGRNARFMVTVYDEINISAPIAEAGKQMETLRWAMERPRLISPAGVTPVLSDGKRGYRWGDLVKCP
jgi:DNA polymerase I-like protein with 3'-5' exonuclease and polymerase domains